MVAHSSLVRVGLHEEHGDWYLPRASFLLSLENGEKTTLPAATVV